MNKNKYPYSILKSFAALALLGIYCTVLLVNNLPDFLTHNSDDHQHEFCTPELEKDSCHRNVFHNDEVEGCDHKTHFHPPKSNIDFFKAVVASHFLPKQLTFDALQLDNFIQLYAYKEPFILKNPNYSFSLRGPPFTV